MAGREAAADTSMSSIPSPRPLISVLQSMGAGGGRRRVHPTAHMIIVCIVNITSFALCVDQFYRDWEWVNGDLVFNNFSLVDKLASCFKVYIVGYDALHTKGSEMFGFVSLLGCFLQWFAIAYHLIRNYRTWIRTRVLGMVFVSVAGVSLLCRGMVISKDNAWHANGVPAITIGIVLIDGVLLIRGQIKKKGDSEHRIRNLVMKSVETAINIFRLVDSIGRTHKPCGAEKILRLVGSGLSVLFGIGLIGLMVIEWHRKNARVFTVDEDGNAEKQAAEKGVDVELAVQA